MRRALQTAALTAAAAIGLPGAIVVAFTPPSIPGLSRFGGFEFQVLDLGGTDISALARGTQAMVAAGNQSPRLRGLFSRRRLDSATR